ncbi:hypothetical protein [Roseibium sp. M-1]
MTAFSKQYFKHIFSGLFLAGMSVSVAIAFAEDGQKVPWEEQPLVLNKAVDDYLNSRPDVSKSKIKIGNEIRILYLGFSKEEIAKNAESFPEVPGYKFVHLPYGRKKYYAIQIDVSDFLLGDTVVALNLDLEREIRDWSEGLDPTNVELTEILDPRGQYIHNLALALYTFNVKKSAGNRETVIELGAPLDDLKDADHAYRKSRFETSCSSSIEFVEFEDERPQINDMFVYSSAEPGSAEQIDCLVTQTMIFVRPESVPYRSISVGK